MKKSRLMIAGSAISFVLFAATPSFAQDQQDDTAAAQTDDEEKAEEESSGPILVTGSRIARPTLESSVPLTSVTVEDLTRLAEQFGRDHQLKKITPIRAGLFGVSISPGQPFPTRWMNA